MNLQEMPKEINMNNHIIYHLKTLKYNINYNIIMHYFNEITDLLNLNKYKQFSTKNNNRFIFKRCLYDLTEICIEEKNEKYILSVPFLTDIHYKTTFTEPDKLFTYLEQHLQYLEENQDVNAESQIQNH